MKLRSFLIFATILLTPSVQAASKINPALKCLALEEERYHKKKITNSRSKLNQDLIIELSQSSDFILKSDYLSIVCSPNTISPAEKLLELQLIYGTKIFETNSNEMTVASLMEYKKQLPQVFIKHIANLQSELETANCLEKNIPEIKKINDKIKYLEEDLSVDTLLPFQKEIATIFRKLEKFNDLKKKCRKPREVQNTN